MPLSEHEQHLLEQMEQALYAEDPKFASHMVGSAARRRLQRRIGIGVAAALVGLALVVIGVMNQKVWLGGVGFAVMVAGAVWAMSPPRSKPTLASVAQDGTVHEHPRPTGKIGKPARRRRAAGNRGTFMQRLESRWDRRKGDHWH